MLLINSHNIEAMSLFTYVLSPSDPLVTLSDPFSSLLAKHHQLHKVLMLEELFLKHAALATTS